MMGQLTWSEVPTLRGAGSLLLLMGCFGIGWSMMMADSWTTPVMVILAVVFIALAVCFYVFGILTMRRLRLWAKAHAPRPAEVIAQGRKASRNFIILFGTEIVLIGAAVFICHVVGHVEFVIPLCVLIMGAHFVPFAFAYHRRFDYLPGILAILVGIAGIAAVAGGADQDRVLAMLGLGAVCCTTIYGFHGIWLSRKLSRD